MTSEDFFSRLDRKAGEGRETNPLEKFQNLLVSVRRGKPLDKLPLTPKDRAKNSLFGTSLSESRHVGSVQHLPVISLSVEDEQSWH